MTEKLFEDESWRETTRRMMRELLASGHEPYPATLGRLIRDRMPAMKMFEASLDAVQHVVGTTLKADGRLSVTSAVNAPATYKPVEQLSFDELRGWVRLQLERREALYSKIVAGIEQWLGLHPEVALTVSDVLAQAE